MSQEINGVRAFEWIEAMTFHSQFVVNSLKALPPGSVVTTTVMERLQKEASDAYRVYLSPLESVHG